MLTHMLMHMLTLVDSYVNKGGKRIPLAVAPHRSVPAPHQHQSPCDCQLGVQS